MSPLTLKLKVNRRPTTPKLIRGGGGGGLVGLLVGGVAIVRWSLRQLSAV